MAEPKSAATEPLYARLKTSSVVDVIAERIERLILNRELEPGAALPPERELASQLSVSRNVVREALRSVAQKGLIQVIHGRGAFVTEPSAERLQEALSMLLRLRQVSLIDLCDARMLLEPEIAALAAKRATRIDHARLRELLADLEASEDAAAHVEADLALHRGFAAIACHTVYEAITEAVRVPVTRSMLLGTSVPRAIGVSDDQHRAIVAAIIAGDPDKARNAMAEHIRYVREYIAKRARKGKRRS